MIDLGRRLKNFGPLETLVLSSLAYVVIMLIWTASTRSAVVQKANDIKANHKLVVEFINNQVNECSLNEKGTTMWGDNCNSAWTSSKIVNHILKNRNYEGWLVVEAEQDPAKANPFEYAKIGYNYLSKTAKECGFNIIS